jgi:hypothetical protein
MDNLGALIFDGFELLDAFGPLEAFGHLSESGKCRIVTIADVAGDIASRQGPKVVAISISRIAPHFRCCWYREDLVLGVRSKT